MAGHCPPVRSGILARTSTRASAKVNPAVFTVPDPKLLPVGREQMTEPVQEYPTALVPREAVRVRPSSTRIAEGRSYAALRPFLTLIAELGTATPGCISHRRPSEALSHI